MAYSFRRTIPELAGVLIKEKVYCGKKNCRCLRQNKPHKWFYYLYYRDPNNKSLKKRYIQRTNVRKLRRKIKIAKESDRRPRAFLRFNNSLLRNLLK